jgi:RHS repeat-associated protein
MTMPGRKFSTAGSGYRYGFNGKEKDKDAGEGMQDYGMRIYDGRLGRFLSEDPLTKSYPELSPYQYADNSPILFIDIDGLEPGLPWYYRKGKYSDKPVLTFGAKNLSKAKRIEYSGAAGITAMRPTAKGGIFVYNSLVSAWNNIANTFNDGLDGKNGSQMLIESVQSMEKLKLSDLKNVETWENIAGGILTAYVARRITRSFGGAPTSSQAALVKNRIETAKNFYKQAGFDEKNSLSHMNGIDMTKKVFETTLEKGTVLEQWTYLDTNGKPKLGNYYTLPGSDPSKLGIPLENRVKTTVTLRETTTFLQSTTGDIQNWNNPSQILNGGETQLFQTNVKVDIKK